MTKLESTVVVELHMSAFPASKLSDCMREAVLVACSEWQNVVLTYHGRKYRVMCNDLLACVVESGDKPGGSSNVTDR